MTEEFRYTNRCPGCSADMEPKGNECTYGLKQQFYHEGNWFCSEICCQRWLRAMSEGVSEGFYQDPNVDNID